LTASKISMTQTPTLTPKHFRRALWIFFYACIALQCFWYSIWVPARLPLVAAISIALVPLAPGLALHWFRNKYAIIWAGFGILGHFTFAAMEAVIAGANRAPAILSCFLCCGFFLSWNFFVLGEKRVLRQHNPQRAAKIK
jgi:uncharacterized membrane protein